MNLAGSFRCVIGGGGENTQHVHVRRPSGHQYKTLMFKFAPGLLSNSEREFSSAKP